MAQIAHLASFSATNNVNTTKISPKDLFLESWLLTKSSYWDSDLNNQNWARWKKRYINKIETDEDAHLAINTMLASLNDSYSKFLDAREYADQNSTIDSKIYGIGVNIASIAGKTYIINTVKGAPADIAGIKQGDMLLKVDGTDISGKSTFQVAQYIKGRLGDYLDLELLRDSKKIAKRVKREEIKVKTVEYNTLPHDVGYIRILSFISQETPAEFVGALDSLKDSKALVLDLRGNAGGLFQNALFVANLFLQTGKIVSVIGREGDYNSYMADKDGYFYDKPLVVLVDGDSASASEIVSGALKDHNRAKIIGTRTFGKGLVQKVYAMPNKTGMNLTIARYLTPSGEDINHKGILPDFVVEFKDEDYVNNVDRQLEFAQGVLKKELAENGQERTLKELATRP